MLLGPGADGLDSFFNMLLISLGLIGDRSKGDKVSGRGMVSGTQDGRVA